MSSSQAFNIGDEIECNLGPLGWALGRVVALKYREDHWPKNMPTAPYQVMLEEHDRRLIYVPKDDDRFRRKPVTKEVSNIVDALAAASSAERTIDYNSDLTSQTVGDSISGYRDGKCECCDRCPQNWSAVELYSEHYRAATRNGLKITRHLVELGSVNIGTTLQQHDVLSKTNLPCSSGFLQCPTLPRLPPGLVFEDDGSLSGVVQFDPNRGDTYDVQFVAVSTADWENPKVGLVRLEITLKVVNNVPPEDFDVLQFQREENAARARGDAIMDSIYKTWGKWEKNELDNQETIALLTTSLNRLRDLLEEYPNLDQGMWWTQLGGYYMNVHKLLENKLFECELYLGQALLFGDSKVRRTAEQNLEGCYQKRLLETARYLWMDGLEQLLKGEYATAVETLNLASTKYEGWGWGINNGDIWISEAAARILNYGYNTNNGGSSKTKQQHFFAEVEQLMAKAKERYKDATWLGQNGHPWAFEITNALKEYRKLLKQNDKNAVASGLEDFKKQTTVWCVRVVQGTVPFPPKSNPRNSDDAEALKKRLPWAQQNDQ